MHSEDTKQHCTVCTAELDIVRPGKWVCYNCEYIDSMKWLLRMLGARLGKPSDWTDEDWILAKSLYILLYPERDFDEDMWRGMTSAVDEKWQKVWEDAGKYAK